MNQSIVRQIFLILKTAKELFVPFMKFKNEKRIVSIFGSARSSQDHSYYKLGVTVGGVLANAGYTVLTGAGPGTMEAVNKGAKNAGGRSLGLGIVVPHEQKSNSFLDKAYVLNYFWIRKYFLITMADAFVFLPGGTGTMDELFEVINFIQSGKSKPKPVLICAPEYWAGLFDWMKNMPLSEKNISNDVFSYIHFVSEPSDILKHI